jgi:hypothetical protein
MHPHSLLRLNETSLKMVQSAYNIGTEISMQILSVLNIKEWRIGNSEAGNSQKLPIRIRCEAGAFHGSLRVGHCFLCLG